MACVFASGTIDKICGEVNAPNLTRILSVVGADDITTIAAATAHVISTDFTMVATKVFFKWNFAKEDNSYTSERDPETGLWKTEVKIFVPKLQATTTNILNGMNGDNYIVVVKDLNGKNRLIGALDNGCRVAVKEQTSPKNGYEITISWESANAPYFYTGAIAY
jgi:hypothetical protein